MHGFAIAARFFQTKGERSGVVLDQLIALSISKALFQFSNLAFEVVYASQRRALALGGLKALLLYPEYLSPEMHQLSVEFIGGRNDLRFIQRLCGCADKPNCLPGSGEKGHNVHKSSPSVGKGGVGTPDSTFGGNHGEGDA